jgi:hypothetical protein
MQLLTALFLAVIVNYKLWTMIIAWIESVDQEQN